MYWDSYIIRSFYNNGGNVIFYLGTGSATSSDFDITLLICLLRNMTPKVQRPPSGFDKLPINSSDVSIGDDMARIKYYRNDAVHNKSGKMTNQDFQHQWNILENVIITLNPKKKWIMFDFFPSLVVNIHWPKYSFLINYLSQ